MDGSASLVEVADSILYISSLLADGPRPIDEVIDYFGGPAREERWLDAPRRSRH